jgi:hypothetical protein
LASEILNPLLDRGKEKWAKDLYTLAHPGKDLYALSFL